MIFLSSDEYYDIIIVIENVLIPPNSFVCCQEWAGNQLKEYTDSLGCKARDNKMTYTKLNKSLNYNPPKLRVEKE